MTDMLRGNREVITLPAGSVAAQPAEDVTLVDLSWARPVVYRVVLRSRTVRAPNGNGNDEPPISFVAQFELTEGLHEASEVSLWELATGAFLAGREDSIVLEGVASQVRVRAHVTASAAPDGPWLVLVSAVAASFADATQRGEAEKVR